MRSPQLPLSATGRARQFHYDVVVLAADATDCRRYADNCVLVAFSYSD